MKFFSWCSIIALSGFMTTTSGKANGFLAPELNKNHPHKHRRNADSLKYTICFSNKVSSMDVSDFKTQFSEFIIKDFKHFNIVHVEIPDVTAQDVLLDMRAHEAVEVVENILTTFEQNMYWNKARIQTENFSDVTHHSEDFLGMGADTYIFIVDSGVDDHVEFGNRIDRDLSKGIGDRTDSYDCRGHGTSVAGVSAGRNSGVAKLSTIVSYAVSECLSGAITTDAIHLALEDIIDDIIFLRDNEQTWQGGSWQNTHRRKFVVNLSNGLISPGEQDLSIKLAEEAVEREGGVVIRAAGNLGADSCLYGNQNLPHSVSVGSTNELDKLAVHSNHGSCVDLLAPGENIAAPLYSKSSNSGKGISFVTGTSFAAPLVAGAMASIMAHYNLTGEAAREHLLTAHTADGKITGLPANTVNKLLHLPGKDEVIAFEDEEFVLVPGRFVDYVPSCSAIEIGPSPPSADPMSFEDCKTLAATYSANVISYSDGVKHTYDHTCVIQLCTSSELRFLNSGHEPLGLRSIHMSRSLAPDTLDNFVLERANRYRNQTFVCTDGTKHTLEQTESVFDCLDFASFAKAKVFNYNVVTKECQLLSCPSGLKPNLTPADEDGWILYSDYMMDIQTTTTAGYRLFPGEMNYNMMTDDYCQQIPVDDFPCGTAISDDLQQIIDDEALDCDYMRDLAQITVREEHCSQYCEHIEDCNAFSLRPGLALDAEDGIGYCDMYSCPQPIGNTDFTKMSYKNGVGIFRVEARIEYLHDGIIPEDYKGFELQLNSGGNQKLDCDSFAAVENINVEECAQYTTLLSGNAFNFNHLLSHVSDTKTCEPLLCTDVLSTVASPPPVYQRLSTGGCFRKELGFHPGKNASECESLCTAHPDCISFETHKVDLDKYCYLSSSCTYDISLQDEDADNYLYIRIVKGDFGYIKAAWFMYVDEQRLVENKVEYHVQIDSSLTEEAAQNFGYDLRQNFTVLNYEQGTLFSSIPFKSYVIEHSGRVENINGLLQHPEVISIEKYDEETLSFEILELSDDRPSNPLANVQSLLESGQIEYRAQSNKKHEDEAQEVETNRDGEMYTYTRDNLEAGAHEYIAEDPMYGNVGHNNYKGVSGGRGATEFQGEFGVPLLQGEFSERFLNLEFSERFLNLEFSERFLNLEFSERFLNLEFSERFLNLEFSERFLNLEFSERFLNLEFSERFLNLEFSERFLNLEFSERFLNLEFSERFLNLEFSERFLNLEFSERFLNLEFSERFLNLEFSERFLNLEFGEERFLSSEFSERFLNLEFSERFLNLEFSERFLNLEFADRFSNVEYGLSIIQGDFGFPFLREQNSFPILEGDINNPVLAGVVPQPKFDVSKGTDGLLGGMMGITSLDNGIVGELNVTRWGFSESSAITIESQSIRQIKYQTAVIGSYPASPNLLVSCNIDDDLKYQGFPISTGSIYTESPQDCGHICSRNKECKFWSYDPTTEECSQQTSDENQTEAIGFSSGASCGTKCDIERDIEYSGVDLDTVDTKDYNGCGLACLRDSNCKFWTFDSDTQKCYKKSSKLGNSTVYGSVSGAACGNLCVNEIDISYVGGEIDTFDVTDQNDCAKACLLDSACAYWSFNISQVACTTHTSAAIRMEQDGFYAAKNCKSDFVESYSHSEAIKAKLLGSATRDNGIITLKQGHPASQISDLKSGSSHVAFSLWSNTEDFEVISPESTVAPSYSFSSSLDYDLEMGWLDSDSAWIGTDNLGDYYQIDLGSSQIVSGIVTQSRNSLNGFDHYIMSYTVQLSSDGSNFVDVDGGAVFTGNSASDDVRVTNSFAATVNARFVRIIPETWNGYMAMRAGVVTGAGIYSPQVAASSSFSFSNSFNSSFELGWIDSNGAWAGSSPGDYYEIDLGVSQGISGVATQGHYDLEEYVQTYTVEYSINGVNFTDVSDAATFDGNTAGGDEIVTNNFARVTARYVRIYPQTYFGRMSMRSGVVVDGTETVSFEVSARFNGSGAIYAYAGSDLLNYASGRRKFSVNSVNFTWHNAGSFELKKGFNQFYIGQFEESVEILSVRIIQGSAIFYEAVFPKTVYKLISDPKKSVVLDCKLPILYNNINSVEQCANLAATNQNQGFAYRGASQDCVIQKCDSGFYSVSTGGGGWVSYVASGLFPSSLHGFDYLPTNTAVKLTCAGGVEADTATYSNVVSVEACLNRANSFHEQFINYKVSRGQCQLLACSHGIIDWEYTESSSDIYSYAKDKDYFEVVSPQSPSGSPSFSFSDALDPSLEEGWLDSQSAWATATDGDYYQVDLGSTKLVTGVVTQARYQHDEYVTSYSVSYSVDDITYLDLNGGYPFDGNVAAGDNKVTNNFPGLLARYIRITPLTGHNHMAMRSGVLVSGTELNREEFAAAFTETGCPSAVPEEQLRQWIFLPASQALTAMHEVCETTMAGTATRAVEELCCGRGRTCTPVCELQQDIRSLGNSDNSQKMYAYSSAKSHFNATLGETVGYSLYQPWLLRKFQSGYKFHKVTWGSRVNLDCPLIDVTDDFRQFYMYNIQEQDVTNLYDLTNQKNPCLDGSMNETTILTVYFELALHDTALPITAGRYFNGLSQKGSQLSHYNETVEATLESLANGTAGFVTFDLWSLNYGPVTIDFDIYSEIGGPCAIVYAGDLNILNDFDDEKTVLSCDQSVAGDSYIESHTFTLNKGANKLLVAYTNAESYVRFLKIMSLGSFFTENKEAQPLIWNDYVSISSGFSEGHSMGKKIAKINTVHTPDYTRDSVSAVEFELHANFVIEQNYVIQPAIAGASATLQTLLDGTAGFARYPFWCPVGGSVDITIEGQGHSTTENSLLVFVGDSVHAVSAAETVEPVVNDWSWETKSFTVDAGISYLYVASAEKGTSFRTAIISGCSFASGHVNLLSNGDFESHTATSCVTDDANADFTGWTKSGDFGVVCDPTSFYGPTENLPSTNYAYSNIGSITQTLGSSTEIAGQKCWIKAKLGRVNAGSAKVEFVVRDSDGEVFRTSGLDIALFDHQTWNIYQTSIMEIPSNSVGPYVFEIVASASQVNIDDVEFFCVDENVARGKPTTSTDSTSLSGVLQASSFAVDGSLTTAFVSEKILNNWIEVDLVTTYPLAEVVLGNQENVFESRLDGFVVSLLDDARQEVATYNHSDYGNQVLASYTKSFDAPVNARYIKISRPNIVGRLQISEIRAYTVSRVRNPSRGFMHMPFKLFVKETSAIQILRPVDSVASPLDCIHWHSEIVLSAAENYQINENCGIYGCLTASMRNQQMVFTDSGMNPSTFILRPPQGIFRSHEQCIYPGDKIIIASRDPQGLETTFQEEEDFVTFGASNSSTLLSLHLDTKHRSLKWDDHVVINTAFKQRGSLFGKGQLFTESDESGALLESASSNFRRSSFRLLRPETIYGNSNGCISWGDEIVLKLNNAVTEIGCGAYYGCRVAYDVDEGDHSTLRFGLRDKDRSNMRLFVTPPPGVERSGCVRAGEQLQLALNPTLCDGGIGCRVSRVSNGSLTFSDQGQITSSDLLSFQTFV